MAMQIKLIVVVVDSDLILCSSNITLTLIPFRPKFSQASISHNCDDQSYFHIILRGTFIYSLVCLLRVGQKNENRINKIKIMCISYKIKISALAMNRTAFLVKR